MSRTFMAWGAWLMACAAIGAVFDPLGVKRLFAQTSPRADQVRGIPGASPEAAWCPGDPLRAINPQTLAIGPAWTDAAPCYAHFNLTPPAGIDPISVSSFKAPAIVTLAPGAWQDDLYVYLQAPAFSGSTTTRPQRIVVQTTMPGNVTCSNCIVESASTGLRMFPAFSMPVGLARVVNGQLHPSLDPIIGSHQLYIGANLGVAVRRDGPGIWIELSQASAVAAAQQAAVARATGSLEVARARALASQPMPVQRLDALEAQQRAIQKDFMEIVERIPATPAEVEELKRNVDLIREATMRAQDVAMEAATIVQYTAEERLRSTAEELGRIAVIIDPAAEAGKPCPADGPAFGRDQQKNMMLCEAGKWRRLRTR